MEFINEDLQKYAEDHTSSETPLLAKINRHTHANVMMPRMLSGHLQGRVLSTFAQMIKPKTVLEIGTYTGYSAICLAEGLAEGGRLYTVDVNEELEDMVRGFFEEAGLSESIEYMIGNAMEIIPEIKEEFDLVFIDADKINYGNYFDMTIDKVRKGGFIIADNVLWSGKVLLPRDAKVDKDTQAIIDFNAKVHTDDRVENVLFPVRDGLMVLRKK
ncbi:MAG: O-methyltransferase [Bacteroidota bacterium]